MACVLNPGCYDYKCLTPSNKAAQRVFSAYASHSLLKLLNRGLLVPISVTVYLTVFMLSMHSESSAAKLDDFPIQCLLHLY